MGGRKGALEGLDMISSFWRGRKVFITGHTGFKGGWLALWLRQLEAQVSGFALNAPTTPSLFELAELASDIASTVGDIRDRGALEAALHASEAEVVFHLAAQPLVRRSYTEPVETYATNVIGTVNLLEAIRSTPSVRAVVVVTSDKCYHNREWQWGYRENEALGGFDPYSSSKACAELVTAAYRSSYFSDGADGGKVAVASARAGNVIGGGDWAEDRLLPDMLRAFAAGRPVRIRHPQARRPWQHVLEPLSGYLQLAESLFADGPAHATAWNFGPSEETDHTVQWIVQRTAALWGDGARWELDEAAQPHEANQLRLDSTRALLQLRWKPRWNLEQALARVVDWHRAQLDGRNMRAFTLEQIEDYTRWTNY